MPGSNIGRSSDSPSNPGQYFRCNSMNSVAIWIASAFESVFRIAQPPTISLLSENGPSVTVILPLASRPRAPSLLGNRPPVSTRVPFFIDFSTNLPIASIKAGGGPDSRYDSEWRMNVRYFMAPPGGSDHATNEHWLDRHARSLFFPLGRSPARWTCLRAVDRLLWKGVLPRAGVIHDNAVLRFAPRVALRCCPPCSDCGLCRARVPADRRCNLPGPRSPLPGPAPEPRVVVARGKNRREDGGAAPCARVRGDHGGREDRRGRAPSQRQGTDRHAANGTRCAPPGGEDGPP